MLQRLSHDVHASLQQAHRPRTARAYDSQFKLFLAFAAYVGHSDIIDIHLLLAFMQFLSDNNIAKNTVSNYVSAIKNSFMFYGLDNSMFHNYRVTLLLKSFAINAPLKIKTQAVIDFQLLEAIIKACQYLDYPGIFRAIFLTAFFSFLRISNLVPSSPLTFNVTRHLARGDFILASPGAHIIIKWSKTLQHRNSYHVVQIPFIQHSMLCPVTAVQVMCQMHPGHADAPLFMHPITKTSITQAQARRALARIVKHLGFSPGYITFHSFRRAGATAAFNNNVHLQHIQTHGGWRSSAVWTYLKNSHLAAGVVANTFKRLLQSPTS